MKSWNSIRSIRVIGCVIVCLAPSFVLSKTTTISGSAPVAVIAAWIPSNNLSKTMCAVSTMQTKVTTMHPFHYCGYNNDLKNQSFSLFARRRPKSNNNYSTHNNNKKNDDDDDHSSTTPQQQDQQQDTIRVRIWKVLAERLYHHNGEDQHEITLKQLSTAVGERRLGELKAHLKHVEKQAKTLQNKSNEWKQRRGLLHSETKKINKLQIKQRKDPKRNEIYIKLES